MSTTRCRFCDNPTTGSYPLCDSPSCGFLDNDVEEYVKPIQLVAFRSNHGSVVQFDGHLEDDPAVRCVVTCDHRPARDIWEALVAGETVLVNPEPWSVRWIEEAVQS